MKKWKFLVRIAALLLASLCAVSGALAESGCYDTSDNGGKPRTDIEPGRSDTFGFDPIPYAEQREIISRWPETGSLSPSYNNSESGSGNCPASSSPSATACPPANAGNSSPSSTVCPSDGSGSPSSSNGGATCPPTGSGSASPGGETACPPPVADCEPTPSVPETPSDGNGDDGHYTPGSLTSQERYLLDAINEERTSRGLSALPVDMELAAVARKKSADMIENHYFAHESPNYGRASDMLDDAGYKYTSVSENIARSGSVEKAHVALMSSSGHRGAILGSQWKKIGIGVVNDANGYPYVTELFVR